MLVERDFTCLNTLIKLELKSLKEIQNFYLLSHEFQQTIKDKILKMKIKQKYDQIQSFNNLLYKCLQILVTQQLWLGFNWILINFQIIQFMKFLQAILLFLIVSAATAETISGLTASTFINTVSGSLSGSLRGGRTIYINGIGFPQDPRQLQVWVGSFPCKIPADGVTPTVITCETTDCFSDADIGSLAIKIIVGGTQDYTIPATTYTYADSDTPLIVDVFPSATIAGSSLSYYAKHKVLYSGDGIRDMGDFIGLFVGGSLCSMFDIDQGSIAYNSVNRVQCVQSPLQEAGKYNITEHVVAGWAKKDYTMRKASLSKIYYEHTVLPSVQSFTPVVGFNTGQDLTIEGTGFSYDSTKLQVKVDGVACDVASSTLTEIQCRLRAKQTSDSGLISSNSSSRTKGYVSGSGFDYWRYDTSRLSSQTLSSFKNAVISGTNLTLVEKRKMAQFDTADIYGGNYGQVFKGYFYAPVEGNYIFRGAADDLFSLLMSSDYGSTSAPLTEIISTNSVGASYDNYYISNISSTLGSPISLQAGKYYYMELYHLNTGGTGFLRMSVEVPNSDTTLPKQRFELNHFQTTFTNDPEIMQFALMGATGGKFNLSITRINPSTLQTTYNKAVTLNYNASATQFQNAIAQFDIFSGYGVTCTSAAAFDATGQSVLSNSGLGTKFVWTIKVDKLRTAAHLAEQLKARFDNLTNLTGSTPTFTQTRNHDHCPLIGGTFTMDIGGASIKLYDSVSKTYSMFNIPYNVGASALQSALRQIVGFEKVEVTRSGDPLYGAKWLISYNQYMKDVPDIVLSGSKLVGGLAGTTPVIAAYVTRPYSSNIIFNPVNEQFLFSAAADPQVVVSVNGIKSSCINDCSYTFLSSVPEVTSQLKSGDLSGKTIAVLISDPLNQNFPISEITAKVDGQVCTITSGSFASFECELPLNLNGSPQIRAGSYDVEVFIANRGLVGIRSGIPKLDYDLTLSLTIPTTGSKNGGFSLQINGSGFPNLANQLQVTLCNVTAKVTRTSNVATVIIAPPCATGPHDITYTYKTFTKTISFTYSDTAPTASIDSISPSTWSPVLKSVMTITGTGFGSNANALTIFLANDTGKIYQMRVLSVNDTTITCGIPGGLAGDYNVQVSIQGVGDVTPSANASTQFSYLLAINNISPRTGSYYGGTLVTISGINFSPDILENAVSIGNQLNTLCRIQQLSSSQIKCRMPQTHPDWLNSTQDVIVSNRLIADSVCPSSNCDYTYMPLDASPNITSLSTTVTVTSGKGTLLITGNRLNAVAGAKVILENRLTAVITIATVNAVTPTTVNFTLPNVQAGIYWVRVRLDPIGETNSLLLNLSASLNSTAIDASTGGGAFILKGYGLPQTWPSKLFTLIVTFNSIPIDINVISTSSSVMEIVVPEGADTSAYSLSLKTPLGSSVTATLTQRTNSTPTYSLLLSTSPTTSGSQLIRLNRTTLNGKTPFNISYYNIIDPLNLTPVPTWSYNGAAVEFTTNMKAGAYKFVMWYNDYGWASCPFTLQITASVTYTAANAVSSYMGGRLTVIGSDISPSAVIKVGGFAGKVVDIQSSSVVFEIPALMSSDVVTQFPSIAEQTQIQPQAILSDGGSSPESAFDTLHATYYSSSAASCYIGIDAGAGKVVDITRIRYFPYYKWSIAAKYIKGGAFEASNDGTTYTQIGSVDQTVHAGWNSIKITSSTNYRYIRFKHTSVSGCKLSQFQVYGILLNNVAVPDITSFATDAIFTDGYNQLTLPGAITYTLASTPVVTRISPNNGTIYGNTLVTFTGTNFNAGTPSVYIDGIECVVNPSTITTTQFKCTTQPRLTKPQENTFTVTFGTVKPVLKDQFFYVMRWSDVRTWGTDLPPVEGDLVYVPKGMTLFVDQSTPRLDGIVVEDGKIIFADEKDMEIHTNLITVNRGEFRAGTEQKPYQNKLTFIMYGSYYGKQQPMFGNKGIGCMECKFSMHGTPRVKTWTMVANTINAGDATFDVMDTVDWVAGEQIVVASTDFDHNQAEQRTIVSVSGTTITVDQPFQFKHFGGVETYGSDTLQMRAEVGLLTRNIKMMGDPTSEAGQYGSHLMMAGSAENGLVSHIAYTEFTHCGQPRIVGRYCIHFHMNGDVADSYAKGNAVHHSFARVITLHGVHYLRVSENVGYRVKGHNFFVQDGIETQNIIENNLAIGSLQSFNMMQTDISVASFWITNPSNHLRNNHAAGGDFYGFWYEIKPNPDGPSATSDVCPIGNPLGESHDNVAHSYKRFGLRIFRLSSRQVPCSPIRNDLLADPWSQNPSIQSRFYNYVTYKIGEAGVLAEETGNTLFENFVIAQSKLAGMQFYRTNLTRQLVEARNIVIIGITQGNAPSNTSVFDGARGVIGPRTSGWKMSNIRFYNFSSTMTILQSCSKCDSIKLYTNTAQEYFVDRISYSNVAGSYLFMKGLKRQIIYDTDGSFTKNFDNNNRSSATLVSNYKHIAVEPACLSSPAPTKWDNALTCNSSITIRKVMFTNLGTQGLFQQKQMRVQQISDLAQVITNTSTTYTQFFSLMNKMEPKKQLPESYAIAYITGRTYSAWYFLGIDFLHMAMDVSKLFQDTDQAIIFRFNHTENRELYQIGHLINTKISGALKSPQANGPLDPATCNFGDYTHDPVTKILTICATSRGKIQPYQYMDINGIRCRYLCPADSGEFVKEPIVRLWSNVTQWPNGRLPIAGDNVTIPGEWTIIIDVVPAQIGFWLVYGDVIVSSILPNLHIKAKGIWVRAGSIQAGTSSVPHPGKITFQLLGLREDPGFNINEFIGGNKLFVVTGQLNLYGNSPSTTWTRALATVRPGATSIKVGSVSGWQVGDKIVIGPSFRNTKENEMVTITAIDTTLNLVTFTPALQFTHYGASGVTVSNSVGTLDTRAAVGHITRNIRIIAGPDDGWGFQLTINGYLATLPDNSTKLRSGSAILQGVEFENGGQYETQNYPLKILNTVGTNVIRIYRSTFHECKTVCIDISNINNAQLRENVLYRGRVLHVRAIKLQNYIFQNNLMIAAYKNPLSNAEPLIACYLTYDAVTDQNISITSNLCQGSDFHGFALPHVPCDYIDAGILDGNTVGSAIIGFIFGKVDGACMAASGVKAYACQIGQIAGSPQTEQIMFQKFMIADSGRGATLRFGKEGDDRTAYFSNSYISAISRPSCSECYGPGAIDCANNFGVRMLAVTVNGEHLPKKFGRSFDVICKQQGFDAKAFLTNITFQNFNRNYPSLPQCSNNVVFKPHDLASDMTGSHHLKHVVCNGCSLNAMALFTPPNPAFLTWFGGCGSILCTGKNNYLIHDHTGNLLGSPSILLANNSQIGDNTANCTFIPEINGHHCKRQDLAVIEYESIAPDFNTRIMWPVYLKFEGGSWNTTTNGWRQWQWQGNQPLNKRLGRFVSVIQTHKVYNMTFESQPPIDIKFQFQQRSPQGNNSDWIIIKLYYPRPNSIRVQNKTGIVKPISLLDNNGQTPLNTAICGSNKFFYQNYTVHFVLTGDKNCQVRVSLTNSIQLNARINMDINDFFNNDGQTKFIDRMCAVLGITDTSRLKIVGVYSGSVQIVAYIDESQSTTTDNATQANNTASAQQMTRLQNLISAVTSNGTLNTAMASVGLALGDVQTSIFYHTDPGNPNKQEDQLPLAENKIMIGLVVGVVIGATVLVFAGLASLIYVMRKRAKISQISFDDPSEEIKLQHKPLEENQSSVSTFGMKK